MSLEEEHERLGDRKRANWGTADLVWDRKVEGGFPELKVLKQRVRDVLEPQKSLGHSDKHAPAAGSTEGDKQEATLSYEPTFKCS